MAIQFSKTTVTPVTVTRNNVTVTQEQKITELEQRIVRLESLLPEAPVEKKSRAEYMRGYRKRKKES